MNFAAVRKYALSLPEVTEEPHHQSDSFRVKGKIFATVPPEQEYLHVFVSEQSREAALTLYGEFIEKLWWGGRFVGLRVALKSADPSVVRHLVQVAWENKAPPGLRATTRNS